MTRKEALRELMDIRDEATSYPDAVCYVTSEDEDALNMAIEVLQAQTDGDLISRQDAIDAMGEEPPVWYDGEDEIAERNQWRRDKAAIESLPSADAVEVVRCKDCKHRRGICSMRYIEMVGEDERIQDYSTDNGYCSWGERREDGEA